jgi:PIN domain nuclease of toxin-antitoxin system
MRVSLDTHTFLWFVFGDDKLSKAAQGTVEDPECEPLVSLASIWEMTIKHGLGRLPLSEPIARFLESQLLLNEMSVLGIEMSHV